MITAVDKNLLQLILNELKSNNRWISEDFFQSEIITDFVNDYEVNYNLSKGQTWPLFGSFLENNYQVETSIAETISKFKKQFITTWPIQKYLQLKNYVIVAGGDSFIFGNELADWNINPHIPSKFTFPALLCNYIGFNDYICTARPGNSNDAIMRMVIQKCDQIIKENKKMFVLVAWTFPPRFEFPFSFKIDSPDSPFACISVWPNTNRPMVQDFAKFFVKNINIDWYQHYKAVQSVVLLQTYLKHNNIPYCFTAADNIVYSYKNNAQLKYYWDMVDWENWYMFPAAAEEYNTTTERGFFQWAIENKYPVGPDQHPLDKAHEDAAILMKEKIYELVKKSIQQDSFRNQI